LRLGLDAGQRRAGFSSGAAARLMSYDWPGNIRELRTVVSRIVAWPGADEVHDHEVARAMS
jgi:DNA-binding NtrC family response regulator